MGDLHSAVSANYTEKVGPRGSITVRLASCLTGLYSTKLVYLYLIQHKQSSWILTSQTGGQLYSDTSPYKVSECSLIWYYSQGYHIGSLEGLDWSLYSLKWIWQNYVVLSILTGLKFKAKNKNPKFRQDFIPEIRRCRRLLLIGCGTSFYSAIATRQILEELTELPVTLLLSISFSSSLSAIFALCSVPEKSFCLL